MAISNSKRTRFTTKLEEQLRFIQRSCEAFDNGAEDEAIRIATSLRVIFHDKNRNVSLVTHLGIGDSKMLSSSHGHGDWKDYLSIKLDVTSPQPVSMIPRLGDKFQELSIRDWWNTEKVFVNDSQDYSRRMIALSAAEKDGGAHVDDELEKYYEALCEGKYAFGLNGNLEYAGVPPFPQGVTHYANNAHLALIRQFAHEALTSVAHFKWLKNEM